MIRYSGIAAYILLTVGICLGIIHSLPAWKGKTKVRLYKLHTNLSNAGTIIGLLHGVITVIDQYMPFSWSEVLIPFTAKHEPVLNGLGTIAGYGMLIVIFTSDIRAKLGRKVWKLLHMLSYPIFIMSFIHGFFEGTDSGVPGVRMIYTFSIIAVLAITAFRIMVKQEPKPSVKVRGQG
jgi:DMSO/TMAO reductase YedYZ heme-binding membrane subunit